MNQLKTIKTSKSFSYVMVNKFVYDFDTDEYELTIEPQTYYDRPHHSDLMSELYDKVGERLWNDHTVEAYLLLEDGDNALDYEPLPAMTFACYADPIETIINAFAAEGRKAVGWYNANTQVTTPLGGAIAKVADSEDYDEDYDSEDEEPNIDYENVPTMKFVYDENNDAFQPGPEEQTYYDHPHHSELMEELAEHTGNWDMDGIHSGYLYLGHSPDNAITYGEHPTHPGMVMTTIPPHQNIINHFRKEGYPVTHWYEKQKRSQGGQTVIHEIPQELPKTTHRKVAEVGDFSLIKFVSMPNKFLIGENTHHAYLLQAEYGSNAFPEQTSAIGRAWLENGTIHGVGFDFGSHQAQELAIHQLGNWASEHGYAYSPNMEDHIVGLASTTIIDQIKEIANSLESIDYGQCYWNPDKKTVFYNAGDADETEEIEEKFLAIPGVEHVEIGDEQGPPGGWYQLASIPNEWFKVTMPKYKYPEGYSPGQTPQDYRDEFGLYHSMKPCRYCKKVVWTTDGYCDECKNLIMPHLRPKPTLVASAPPAFVYANGHMFYGIDHGAIIDENDIAANGLYGRLHERPNGSYTLELYSDYDPNQTKEQLAEALPILQKRYNITDITENSVIPQEDMADAEQFFA